MAKPTVDTRWASNTVAIPVVDQETGNSVVVLNRLEPSSQYKDEGLKPLAPVLGGAINYKLYADHVMIEWLRSTEVGTVLQFEDTTMTLAQLQADRGGTWIDLGTNYTVYSEEGGLVVRGFKKIA